MLAGTSVWVIPSRYVRSRPVVKVTLVSTGKRNPQPKSGSAARAKQSGRVRAQAQATIGSIPQSEMINEIESNAPPLGPNLQAHIGKQLRAAFQSVLAEPVPPRFVELLERLEKKGDG